MNLFYIKLTQIIFILAAACCFYLEASDNQRLDSLNTLTVRDRTESRISQISSIPDTPASDFEAIEETEQIGDEKVKRIRKAGTYWLSQQLLSFISCLDSICTISNKRVRLTSQFHHDCNPGLKLMVLRL